ncbi:MAG: hypothetical protein JWQ72_1678 [Polaromonas sp.]|nr:hypothetical protein [Polaromonas sp.]
MAFTQTDLDAIDAAIASGELTVKHNGREVTYRSMTDLLKARSTIQAGMSAAANGRNGGSYRYTFATGRGE